IAVVDLASGEDHTLVPGETACFSPGCDAAYARTDLGGELASLARIRDGAITVVAERADAELDSFALAADGVTAALVWNRYGGVSELAILDTTTGVQRPVSLPPDITVVGGCAFAANGSTLSFTVEGPAHPRTALTLRRRSRAAVLGPAIALGPTIVPGPA